MSEAAQLILSGLVGGLTALGAVWLTNRYSRTATKTDRLATHRVELLIDAYRRLEHAGNRPPTPATESDLERAVADLILLGSPTEVAAARAFATEFAANRGADLTPLLRELRDALRSELGLPAVTDWAALRITAGDQRRDQRASERPATR